MSGDGKVTIPPTMTSEDRWAVPAGPRVVTFEQWAADMEARSGGPLPPLERALIKEGWDAALRSRGLSD